MKLMTRWILVQLLVLAVLMAASDAVAADGDKPVKMSEIARLLKEQTPQEVLDVMAQRGVGFRVSTSTEKRLKKYGFDQEQIELIRRIAAGEKIEPAGDADGPGDDADDAHDAADDDAFKVGFAAPDHWHAAEQKRIESAIKSANLGYKRIELGRATLYCSDQRAKKLAPLLKKLEAALIKRFPSSISNASSPKSAHIVVIDGSSEWRSWCAALVDSYEKGGIKMNFGPEADAADLLTKSSGFTLSACTASNASAHPNDSGVSRFAAYSLGHLMMARAGGKEQPGGLITGFGNYTEAMAMGDPAMMVYSYEKRDLKQEGGWKAVVRKLFEDKKINDPNRPWGYETATMEAQNYAECWSLISTLCEAPDKFAQAVRSVREDETFMGTAVSEAYGMADKKLLKAWYKFVSQ